MCRQVWVFDACNLKSDDFLHDKAHIKFGFLKDFSSVNPFYTDKSSLTDFYKQDGMIYFIGQTLYIIMYFCPED